MADTANEQRRSRNHEAEGGRVGCVQGLELGPERRARGVRKRGDRRDYYEDMVSIWDEARLEINAAVRRLWDTS